MNKHGRRVLIIDDDAIICEIAESFLSESGWEVAHAYSPADALQSMAAEDWPVVFCDVHLPGDSGELLAALRRDFPRTQIVMITGDPTVLSMRQAIRAGAYDYLLKPLRREELLRSAEMAFDRNELITQRDALELDNARYREQLEGVVMRRTEQLRDSELRYRTLFDHAADAIFLLRPQDGTILELNGAAGRLLGLKAADASGKPFRAFAGAQLDFCLFEPGDDYRVWHLPGVMINDSERDSHRVNMTLNRIRLENDVVLQVVARETAAHDELEQRAELLELELMSEQRLATIGLLASGVAHNINTPLMGIYGLAQVIKMQHPDIDGIDGVIAQVERINAIIRNLMWKSRQEQEMARQLIDINTLLQEELRFLEADMEFKHNVEKRFEFAHDLPPIFGRYSDFSQSLTNLFRNALDAMHDRELKQLVVTTTYADDCIHISVQDSGIGIAADHLEKVFDPFFTTKPAVGNTENGTPTGTGLGLSTVKKLLTPYGCQFDIQSEPGAGTRFTLAIPVAQNQPRDEELEEANY